MGIRILVLCCALLAVAAQVAAATRQMWVWVDSKGVTHYSDRPVPGAKLISVATMEPSEQPPAPMSTPPVPPSSRAARPAPPAVQYQLLEIFQPANDETFFGADATVDVRIRSEPDLAAGDQMRLYLDGELIARQQQGSEYSLQGLDRGAHTITAQIVDAQGKAKILSEPRVFHIRHETVGVPSRAVGPNLRPRPPPKPTPQPGSGK
jgi:hypothetical protein